MAIKDWSNRLLVVLEVLATLVFVAMVFLYVQQPVDHLWLNRLFQAVVVLWIVAFAWWGAHWLVFHEPPDREHWFGKFTAIFVILAIAASLVQAWFYSVIG